MRFVVLMKQVPADTGVEMNADYTVDRRNAQKITNPADLSALATAAEWKTHTGAELVCLTMGPASAAQTLREGAMAGADRLYHICDPALAGADTFVTAYVLAAAIRQLGGADLIFCGRHTVDGETGQVGAELAAMLGYACISQVLQIEALEPEAVTCVCLLSGAQAQYRLLRPAVLCVCECRHTTVLPSLAVMRKARQLMIQTWTLAELGLSGLSGRGASPTKVCGVHRMARSRRSGIRVPAAQIVQILRGMGGEVKQ